ncbi:Uu.00g078900.m01.CDS01 [Anthostomella pinea]|uniref:Uu.00g078900.m01.CDS01 n=1 Tax=Anthostomella pinea TaxID=933095 RepID=A0AAI8YGS3_9PEZI|nr:Uu.00g078900.m01.CDS01 [Anthostomella pinea]
MAGSRMQTWFPGTSYPLVVSAPMDFVSNARLATEVTKAGGLGFVQGGRDFSPDSPVLKKLDEQLTQAASLLNIPSTDNSSEKPLPIGVGFVTYAPSTTHFAHTTLPILVKHRPAAIWLFAPAPSAPDTLPSMLAALRSAGAAWGLKIAVQAGTVAAAREAVRSGADVVVAQGSDAGGHQFRRGAGVVGLVPEVVDMVREEVEREDGGREVVVWAAGGVADGRGVAAGLALGAEGVVMGTRYMVATESDVQGFKRKAILSTSDGGVNTAKSQLHDHVQGNMSWPDAYDGRAVIHPSLQDEQAGVSLEENTKRFNAAKESGDLSRMVTWSGTGVGLIKEELPAAEITKRVREEALKVIAGLKAAL